MTTYATGNPVPSTAVKDLYDNAENLDDALNDLGQDSWTDRLGRMRKTWSGIERLADANTAIAAADRAEEARDAAINAADLAQASSNTVWVKLHSELVAITDKPSGTPGAVTNDPDPSKNGYYVWDGVSWSMTDLQPISSSTLGAEAEARQEADEQLDHQMQALKRRQSAPLGHTVDNRQSGQSIRSLLPDEPNAELTFAGGEVFIRIDTQSRKLDASHLVSKSLTVTGETIVEMQIGDRIVSLQGDLFFSRDGKVLFSVTGDGPTFDLSTIAPDVAGQLWTENGENVSRVEPDPGYYVGRIKMIGQNIPAPVILEAPTIVLAADSPERANRLFNGVPHIARVPGTGVLWSGFGGDNVHAGEEAGGYGVIKRSFDNGDTWEELLYVVEPDISARVIDNRLWYDERLDVLWMFAGVTVGVEDRRWGTWAWTIKNPSGTKPLISRPYRLSTYGSPTRPFFVDEDTYIGLNIRETKDTSVAPLYVPGDPYDGWIGKRVLRWDRNFRNGLVFAGKVPDTVQFSYQETNYMQLHDGSLYALFRTPTGPWESRSPSGNPAGPWTEPIRSPMIPAGATAESRCACQMTPNGNMVVAFNNSSGRNNLVLGVSLDNGLTLAQTVVLDGRNGVSYPDIDFDDAGNIYITWDYSRTGGREILLGIVNEAELLAGTAVVTTKMIDKKGP